SEDALCDGAATHEGDNFFCNDPAGLPVIQSFVDQYKMRNAVTFALVGDEPHGCVEQGTTKPTEPGQGYIEVANATGGKFGSLCGDRHKNVVDTAGVAPGVPSTSALSKTPASATIRVAVGSTMNARVPSRSPTNGWDYDPASNKIIFY